MASLKEGVLLKLLEEMKTKVDSWRDDPKPALLQIRSIIPVLEEGDLWPNRGFFLKVSDASHALYVSLSRKQNEMILANKLHLGQFIHVQKLENADPLPLLRGVAPIPGRRPCEGTPQDIVSPSRLLKLLQPSSSAVVEKGVIVQKKLTKMVRGGSSDSESSCRRSEAAEAEAGRTTRSSSASKARPGKTSYDRADNINNDSDADSVAAPTPPRASKRRSWSESEILGVKEIFDSSSVVKNEIKLPFRSASANVSPVRSARYDSSDDNSSSVSRNRGGGSAKRVMKGSNKSHEVPATKAKNMQTTSHSLCHVVCDRKGAESRISWSSLPSNLVNHGKEVIRQRDGALQAAVDALQEACVSERLLNSLSTMSQFPLAAGDDLQPLVDKFFNLQHDLSEAGLIMQSLTSITSIGLERKKNANAWIKSAIALDLSTCLSPRSTSPPDPIRTQKHTSTCTKPKDACTNKVNRGNSSDVDHIPFLLAPDKEDEEAGWSRGSSGCAAAELASSLQDECNKLFLIYAEKYLDEVDRKSSLVEYGEEMAEMMCKVKMVGEWLNLSVKKEGCDCDVESYVRVRDKIYSILLKHVERTAMAFDRFKASL